MISFVILHYKNMSDTIECIESIKQLETKKKVSIIVVDNNSCTNEEIKQLEKYTYDIVINTENLGFAKGNNSGCEYAINKYSPDFLVVINNDIVINQKDFIERIYAVDIKFDILGPKIITDGGESVNPFPAYKTLEEVKKSKKKSLQLIKIYQNPILRTLLSIYLKTKYILKKPPIMENGQQSEQDVALHGCALIFSKKYYQKYDTVFYPGTFLYHEEEFLNYRKSKDNLITYYSKDLELYHKEGSSLNFNFQKNEYQKQIFRNREIIKSLSLLETAMENDLML